MDIDIICINCVHLFENESYIKCEAFPKGIPETIIVGTNDHAKPLKDQKNKIVFEPIKK